MYTVRGNTMVKVDTTRLLKLGRVTDGRVDHVEQLIANYYGVSVYDLNTFYKDSPAKLMCCFILHHYLNYCIRSVADHYKINAGFLHNNITEYYKKCLTDQAFLKLVNSFKDAVLYKDISKPGRCSV